MPDSEKHLPAEAAEILKRHPEAVAVDCFFPDLCNVVRGKRYDIRDLEKILREGLTFPGSVFLLDALGESHDPEGFGFSDGDPDCFARALPGTLKPVPWAERPLLQVMLSLETPEGKPYPMEPRNVLRRVIERFSELELTPVVAMELEFYLIDPERGPGGGPRPPISPLTGQRDRATQVYGMSELDAYAGILEDISANCEIQEIPCGAISAEYAPGQFEINLNHVPDPLLAADHCVFFKRAVKGTAARHGLQATFMAKPYPEEAGSGLHMHISLLDKKGNNVFDAGPDRDKAAETDVSQTLRHALGGLMETLPEAMAILAPNPNSYRRFQPNIFVPIARSWGFENRSVAFRIPLGAGKSRRIEHRMAGADANPYLTLATALAGIHHGITQKLDPGAAFEGNAGAAFDEALPFRPRRALEALMAGRILPEYFGADYTRVYSACKMTEQDRFEGHITPLEYDWYLQAE